MVPEEKRKIKRRVGLHGVWTVSFGKDLKLENKTRQKNKCSEGDGGRTLWLEK